MDPEDKDYICTLSEYSLEKAKRELNEDPSQRLGAVQALRAWIRAQPHFTFRVETVFLLNVLRTAKFSQLKARHIIETMLEMRTKCPQYTLSIDTHEPAIVKIVEAGTLVVFPKTTPEGQQIVLSRPGAVDIGDPLITPVTEMRAGFAIQELFKESDENGIVNGAHIIFDMTGISMKHFTRDGAAEQRNLNKQYQDSNVGRIKGFHIYNGGGLIEFMVGLMKTIMKKKYMERTHVHNTMESLYKLFPMEYWPNEYLPDDYKGPSAGPIKALSEDMKRRLMEPGFRARLLDYTQEKYKIDYSKKANDGPQESFRKLNVD